MALLLWYQSLLLAMSCELLARASKVVMGTSLTLGFAFKINYRFCFSKFDVYLWKERT
jgi:hypothetical protein